MTSALRFEDRAGVIGAGFELEDGGWPEPFEGRSDDRFIEKAAERLWERLKGIFDIKGRSTGADAQI
jgi:hypothetical protein